MRISGGEAKGRMIRISSASHVRPTTDRVRESFFNILSTVAEKSFLDLFAGSGIVGLEALSRGASLSVFVEKDIRVAAALKVNINRFGFAPKADVISAPVHRALEIIRGRGNRFDIIFADPPYNEGLAVETIHFLENGEFMAPGGVFVLQHSAREIVGELKTKFTVHKAKLNLDKAKLNLDKPGSIMLTDQRIYGETVLSFFRNDDLDGDSG